LQGCVDEFRRLTNDREGSLSLSLPGAPPTIPKRENVAILDAFDLLAEPPYAPLLSFCDTEETFTLHVGEG
jgi:hypothetical protein